MARPKKNTKQPKAIASTQSLSAFVKSHLRHHAPLQLRQRAAVCAGADLDPVPAHPRRPGGARPARGPRRWARTFTPALPAPTAGRTGPRPSRTTSPIIPRPPRASPSAGSGRSCSPRATASCSTSSTRNCCRICTGWTSTRAPACPTRGHAASSASSAAS